MLSKGTGEKCAEGCQTCRQAILFYVVQYKYVKTFKRYENNF